MPLSIFQFIVLPYLRATSTHTLRALATSSTCCKQETSLRTRVLAEEDDEHRVGQTTRFRDEDREDELQRFRLAREKIPPDKGLIRGRGRDDDEGSGNEGSGDSVGFSAVPTATKSSRSTKPTTFRGKLDIDYSTSDTSRPTPHQPASTSTSSKTSQSHTNFSRPYPTQHIDGIKTTHPTTSYENLDSHDRTALEALQIIVQVHRTGSDPSHHSYPHTATSIAPTSPSSSDDTTNSSHVSSNQQGFQIPSIPILGSPSSPSSPSSIFTRPSPTATTQPGTTTTSTQTSSTTTSHSDLHTRLQVHVQIQPHTHLLPPSLTHLLSQKSYRLATFHALRTPQYATSPTLLYRLADALDKGGAGKLGRRLRRGVERFEKGEEGVVRLWTDRIDLGVEGTEGTRSGHGHGEDGRDWGDEMGGRGMNGDAEEGSREGLEDSSGVEESGGRGLRRGELGGIGRKENGYWGVPRDLDGMGGMDGMDDSLDHAEDPDAPGTTGDEWPESSTSHCAKKRRKIEEQERINTWCDSNLSFLLQQLQTPPDPISQIHLRDLGLDLHTLTTPTNPVPTPTTPVSPSHRVQTPPHMSSHTPASSQGIPPRSHVLQTILSQIHHYRKTHHFQATSKTADLLLKCLLDQVTTPNDMGTAGVRGSVVGHRGSVVREEDDLGKKEIFGIWNVVRRVWERKLTSSTTQSVSQYPSLSENSGRDVTKGLGPHGPPFIDDEAGMERMVNEMKRSIRVIKSVMLRVGHYQGLNDVKDWEKRFDLDGRRGLGKEKGKVWGGKEEGGWWEFDIGAIEGRKGK